MHKVYTKIDSIAGNVITVAAEGIKNEDLAVLSTRDGESLASVIKLDAVTCRCRCSPGEEGSRQETM